MIDFDSKRNAWVTSTLPEKLLVLEAMTGHESLGRGFIYELSLLSNDPNIDLSKLLGERMTVHLTLPIGERTFNGFVTRAQYLGNHDDHTRYHVTLQPWLFLLSHSQNCRIFQNKSVPEIIKDVFRDNGFADFEEVLGTYNPVEFCVQYDESDLNFVSRLMESEGIYYYFKHADEKHTLVMTDSYSGHAKNPAYKTVIYRPPQTRRDMEREHLNHWSITQQIRPGSFEATDYDFKVPKAPLLSRLNAPKSHPHAKGVVFEYPGNFLKKEDGQNRVRHRLEEKQLEYSLVEASGDVRGIGAGALFDLSDYPREDQNKEYLVVTAQYEIHVGKFGSGGTDDAEEFHVGYLLLDSKVPFRPALHTDKPRVRGPQTATVVGPEKEEIWTDPYGRVKVRFHWDRADAKDEARSCFVRVSQVWAGEKWGSMHIPRVGQEVIVDFLEGDPDRPIITGRVYNNLQMPPYDLPANQTQSGIKSRSTPKGGPSNFNEIRFEDKKGAEELFIQAEKNHTTKVKHDRSASVGGSDSVSVSGDRSLSVTGNMSVTVKGSGKGPVHSSQNVTGKYTLDASDTMELQAKTHILLTCGQSSIKLEPGKITIAVAGGASIVLDGDIRQTSKDGSQVVIDKHVWAVAQSKSEMLLDDVQAKLLSVGKASLILKDTAALAAAGGSDATVHGTKVTVTGTSEVVTTAGSGKIKTSAPGVDISGTMVKING